MSYGSQCRQSNRLREDASDIADQTTDRMFIYTIDAGLPTANRTGCNLRHLRFDRNRSLAVNQPTDRAGNYLDEISCSVGAIPKKVNSSQLMGFTTIRAVTTVSNRVFGHGTNIKPSIDFSLSSLGDASMPRPARFVSKHTCGRDRKWTLFRNVYHTPGRVPGCAVLWANLLQVTRVTSKCLHHDPLRAAARHFQCMRMENGEVQKAALARDS
ncbi:tRNA-i(6)A37 methylthiotransferase [Anopheles sinensis]|uniref:tRNA-i(6)A37 methylthiotransferase n=1 Tax=Anopheles sinensis TaxID=74873 RepID=A0A084WTA9_ANOSI|nr:tRNA-i(6)A37 methylthiotransferase [Anopheles sinensis]